MKKAGFTLTATHNGLRRLPREVHRELVDVVTRNTLEVERGARLNTDRVATGAMRAGWYSVTPDGDSYGDATGEAERLQPGVAIAGQAEPADADIAGVVSNAVAYTENHEVGTVYIAADPMLEPALEAQRPKFIRDVGEAVESAARKAA